MKLVDYRKKYSDEKENGILLSDPVDFNNKDIQDKYIFQYNDIFEKKIDLNINNINNNINNNI